ncbi:MAG: ABC transporter ATP-binding protein [Phycisphaerae bacterium]
MSSLAVKASDLHKSYKMGKVSLHVLRGVSFAVKKGEFVCVVGASGSGKSTLLHLIGLIDRADKGHIALDGTDIGKLSAKRRSRLRCREVGFVFQFYHLLPELTVMENTLLPSMVDSSVIGWMAGRKHKRTQAKKLLERLGLGERLKHRPKELSGGERQRVALARALVNSPELLLADEPTGNLDSKTGGKILELLKRFNKETGQTIVMVTHDESLAEQADRVLHLRDGRLSG